MKCEQWSGRPVVTLLLAAFLLAGGCVERTITVKSDPPGARVYLDDIERGETPVTFEFNFYGHRELVLRKDHYEFHREVIQVEPPIYSRFPLDTFFDLLWPLTIKENHTYEAVLRPVARPDEDKLIYRALELRKQLPVAP